jgi:hypothetical protein
MTTIEELPASKEYLEASLRFRHTWLEYLGVEKDVKDEIVCMLNILEDEGYSRTKAIQKIVDDHNDLKGFSRRTIYRELPDKMKRKWTPIDEIPPIVPNDTLTNVTEQTSTSTNTVNITTVYDLKNAETLAETEGEESPLLTVDLPPPEPEIQDPKITPFVGELPKPVLRLAEKIELSPNKLELIKKYSHISSILKDHPKRQERLVEKIAPLTIDEAKTEIAQEIRDLETGATEKIDGSYYFDSTKREKISKKVEREKTLFECYLDFMKALEQVMYLGTGHKLEEGKISYEPNDVQYSENHRIKILSDMITNQLYKFEQDIEAAKDLFENWEHLIIDELVKRGEIAPDHSEDIER